MLLFKEPETEKRLSSKLETLKKHTQLIESFHEEISALKDKNANWSSSKSTDVDALRKNTQGIIEAILLTNYCDQILTKIKVFFESNKESPVLSTQEEELREDITKQKTDFQNRIDLYMDWWELHYNEALMMKQTSEQYRARENLFKYFQEWQEETVQSHSTNRAHISSLETKIEHLIQNLVERRAIKEFVVQHNIDITNQNIEKFIRTFCTFRRFGQKTEASLSQTVDIKLIEHQLLIISKITFFIEPERWQSKYFLQNAKALLNTLYLKVFYNTLYQDLLEAYLVEKACSSERYDILLKMSRLLLTIEKKQQELNKNLDTLVAWYEKALSDLPLLTEKLPVLKLFRAIGEWRMKQKIGELLEEGKDDKLTSQDKSIQAYVESWLSKISDQSDSRNTAYKEEYTETSSMEIKAQVEQLLNQSQTLVNLEDFQNTIYDSYSKSKEYSVSVQTAIEKRINRITKSLREATGKMLEVEDFEMKSSSENSESCDMSTYSGSRSRQCNI